MVRVLIVDDDLEILKILGMRLQRRDHVVEARMEGGDIVEAVKALDAEIAIIDILMPGVSGDYVYHAIRDQIGPGLPIIICSGTKMRLRAPDDMNLAYCPKPIDFDRIGELVDLMTGSPDATA